MFISVDIEKIYEKMMFIYFPHITAILTVTNPNYRGLMWEARKINDPGVER